ncbi:hypothetical protein X798_05478 [Onchocerca flexuosa]|uniref:Uncharacterized protein n=1 Tax=Onchocerca flexuosa TaxID=387005 RepID=A0A238BQ94_9BILA|nr:hypothetical protein X798_05478 [Onchocerca flexuosa]
MLELLTFIPALLKMNFILQKENDMTKNSFDPTTDTAIHSGKPSEENEIESKHSVQIITSVLSPKEQNKSHFEQFQQ